MGANYCNGPGSVFRIFQGNILLHGKMQNIFLLDRGSARIFSNVLTWDDMLHDPKYMC